MADEITCENNDITLESLLKSLFTVDASGNVGIRVVLGTEVGGGGSAITCENAPHMTVGVLTELSIESTPNGPALRLLE